MENVIRSIDPGSPLEGRVAPGDRLLLCSDGFWEGILEADMLRCARLTDNAEQWLRKMREIAEPVASDNNTAIAIVIRE